MAEKKERGLFEDLSGLKFLMDFEGNSIREVLDQIEQIRLPSKILFIIPHGSRFTAVVQTATRLKKTTKPK